jgi:chromosome segregation ATPase
LTSPTQGKPVEVHSLAGTEVELDGSTGIDRLARLSDDKIGEAVEHLIAGCERPSPDTTVEPGTLSGRDEENERMLGKMRDEQPVALANHEQARSTLVQRRLEMEQAGQMRAALEAQVAHLSAELARAAETRALLEESLARTRRSLEILRSEAAEGMRSSMVAFLSDHDEAEALRRKLAERESELAAMRERMQRYDTQEKRLAELELCLNEVLRSRSWRITGPFRRVMRGLRGLRK